MKDSLFRGTLRAREEHLLSCLNHCRVLVQFKVGMLFQREAPNKRHSYALLIFSSYTTVSSFHDVAHAGNWLSGGPMGSMHPFPILPPSRIPFLTEHGRQPAGQPGGSGS